MLQTLYNTLHQLTTQVVNKMSALYTVVRFDRYNVLDTEVVTVSANSLEDAFTTGYTKILQSLDDMDGDDIFVPIKDLKLQHDKAGIDFEEESWLVYPVMLYGK